MDNKFQASFIPKRPVMAGSQMASSARRAPMSLFLIIATAIFVITLLAFGAAFFYKSYVTKQNAAKQEQIKQEVAAFDQDLTNKLTLLKSRLDSGNQLLTNHVAASAFFQVLQDLTVKSIKFSDFAFTALPGDKISVAMKGEAKSYVAVAFQSDTMVNSKYLKNPILSDLHLDDKTGIITFNVKTEIDPSILSYKKFFNAPPATTTKISS